jgi:hypothetical protein
MAVAVTNTLLTALNADQTLTMNAATSSVIDATEAFTITPTGKPNKTLIALYNGAGHGAITYSIAAGANVFKAGAAKTGSIAAGATEVIQLDMGRYTSATGTIVCTLTPASGKRLLTDHASGMWVAELK